MANNQSVDLREMNLTLEEEGFIRDSLNEYENPFGNF